MATKIGGSLNNTRLVIILVVVLLSAGGAWAVLNYTVKENVVKIAVHEKRINNISESMVEQKTVLGNIDRRQERMDNKLDRLLER